MVAKEGKNPASNVEVVSANGAGISACRDQICQSCSPIFSLALRLPLLYHLKYGFLLKLKFLILLSSCLACQQHLIKFPQQLSYGTCKGWMDRCQPIKNFSSFTDLGVGDEQSLQRGITCRSAGACR